MRLLTLGIDDQGRSYVAEEREVSTAPVMAGVAIDSLFATIESPPPRPQPGVGIYDDMPMTPGTVNWMIVDLEPYSEDNEPNLATEMHYNNTIELFYVIEGSIHTALGEGALDLQPGDCVAMPGVDHATHAGPKGARVLSISIALAPTS